MSLSIESYHQLLEGTKSNDNSLRNVSKGVYEFWEMLSSHQVVIPWLCTYFRKPLKYIFMLNFQRCVVFIILIRCILHECYILYPTLPFLFFFLPHPSIFSPVPFKYALHMSLIVSQFPQILQFKHTYLKFKKIHICERICGICVSLLIYYLKGMQDDFTFEYYDYISSGQG